MNPKQIDGLQRSQTEMLCIDKTENQVTHPQNYKLQNENQSKKNQVDRLRRSTKISYKKIVVNPKQK